jgi:hypothetical protein
MIQKKLKLFDYIIDLRVDSLLPSQVACNRPNSSPTMSLRLNLTHSFVDQTDFDKASELWELSGYAKLCSLVPQVSRINLFI